MDSEIGLMKVLRFSGRGLCRKTVHAFKNTRNEIGSNYLYIDSCSRMPSPGKRYH